MKKYLIGLVLVSTFGCQPQSQTVAVTPNPGQSANPVASATTVSSATPALLTGAQQADVQLDKESYTPGQQIDVTVLATGLDASAWVGVVPGAIEHGSEATNDDNDLGYVQVEQGTLVLVAPKEVGDYDVRLNDNDDGKTGKEVASRSFKVVADPTPVTAPKLLWQPSGPVALGSPITVDFEAPISYAENAWIGIVPSATAHGEESVNDSANMGYEHLSGRTRGRLILKVPAEAGSYDVRMFDTDSEGKEVDSVTFEVGQ